MTEYKFTDRANIGEVKRTQDGYLVTQARALRSGVQEYHSSELGIMGDGIVKVYRPEDSVRNPESLVSLAHAPITIGHPDVMVDSENWKDLSVGEVSTAAQWDGEFISLPLILKDKAAIDAVEGGMVELSAGYVADMMPSDNPEYDFVMGPPRYNHLAIVDKARAGSKARIGDAAKPWGAAPLTKTEEKEVNMTDLKTVVVGDKAVQVAAADADVITKMIADHAAKVAEMQTEIEARDAAIGEKMGEIENLKKSQLTDADIEAAAEKRAEVVTKAAKMVDGLDAKGKNVLDIQREALATVYGDEAAKEFPEAAVETMFNVIDADNRKADPVRDTLKDAKKQEVKDSQAEYEARLADAWKGK
jgi:uncharacterized protein